MPNRGPSRAPSNWLTPLATTQSTSPGANPSQGSSPVKPSPYPATGAPAEAPVAAAVSARPSMLDQPAAPAKIQFQGDRLSIEAANASLSELIRQVATKTGMQVEGNSRDERVFGVYGPGSPAEVLSALLYDSGYNVMMVGRMADGAPRRLLLSPRATGAAPVQSASTRPASRNSDDDDEGEPAAEQAQPVQPAFMGNPANPGGPPGTPGSNGAPGANPGQVKTPQQMLEELQRMNRGQQPQELPHDNQN